MIETFETDTQLNPTATRSHLLGEPTGDLVFKIRGGEHHGRVVRLRSLKCTIGSSADCTLRLCAPGVRAIHCLVIRGEAGAVVRRWSPDTQLNGHTFDDALLKVGDRLRVGPVELELLEAEPAEIASTSTPYPTLNPPPNIPSSAALPPVPTVNLVDEITAKIRSKLDRSKYRRLRVSTRKKLAAAKSRILRLKKQIRRVEKTLQHSIVEKAQFQATLTHVQHLHGDAQKQSQTMQAELQSRLELLEQTQRELRTTQQILQERSETWSVEKRELEQILVLKQATQAQFEKESWTKTKTIEELQIDLRIANQVTDETEVQTLKSQLTEALCEREHIKAALNEAIQLHQQIACDFGELHQRHHEINESLELLMHEEQSSRQTMESLRKKIEELEFALLNETTEKEATTGRLQNELAVTQTRVQALENANSVTEANTIDRLNAELQTTKQQLIAAQAAYEDQQSEMNRLRGNLQQQVEQLTQAREHEQAAQRTCTELATQLESLQQQVANDAACFAQHRIRITELEQASSEWQQKLQTLQLEELTNQADASLENAALREELGLLKLHYEDATQLRAVELARTAAVITDLQTKLANRELEFNTQTSDATSKIQALQTQLEALSPAIAAEQQQACNEQWEHKLQAALQAREALQSTIAELTEQLNEQRGQADTQLVARDNMLAQIRDEVREQMRSWETEKAELLAKLASANAISYREPAANEIEPENHIRSTFANAPYHEPEENQYPSLTPSYTDLVERQQDWKSRVPSTNDEDALISEEEVLDSHIAAVDDEDHYIAPLRTSQYEAVDNDPESDARSKHVAHQSATTEDDALNAVLARLGAAGILKGGTPNAEMAEDHAYDHSEPTVDSEVEQVAVEEVATMTADEEPAVTFAATSVSPTAITQMAPSAESHGDDDSIEDYMNKLMRRVRGDSVANAFTTQQKPPSTPVVESKPNPENTTSSLSHEPMPEQEYVPRAQPPEMNVDLSALRELAVNSAHQAIDLSRVRGQKQKAIGTSFAAICAFVCGNVLLYYAQQYGMRWAAFAAIAAFGLGTHWVIQRLKMLRPEKYRPTKSSGPQLPPREKTQHTRTTITEPDMPSEDGN